MDLRQEAFVELRAICTTLLDPSSSPLQLSSKLCALYDHLTSWPEGKRKAVLNNMLSEYILFPIFHILRIVPPEKLSQKILEYLLKCLHFVLSNRDSASPLNINILQQTILTSTILLGGIPASVRPAQKQSLKALISEDIKLLTINCLLEVISEEPERMIYQKNVQSSAKNSIPLNPSSCQIVHLSNELCSDNLRPAVGHLISVILDQLLLERLLSLRLGCLKCLQILMINIIRDPDVLANFLPGVASTLAKVIVAKEAKENHKIFVLAIGLLQKLTVAVMSDEVNSEFITKAPSTWKDLESFSIQQSTKSSADGDERTQNHGAPSEDTQKPFKISKSELWLSSSSRRIQSLLQSVISIRLHHSHNVRIAFIELASDILLRCSSTLSSCIQIMFETLVLYHHDQYPQVSALCLNRVKLVREKLGGNAKWIDRVKHNFHNHVVALSRKVVGLNDTEKKETFDMLVGYVLFLGTDVKVLLSTAIDQLLEGVVKLLVFDTSDLKLVENRNRGDFDLESSLQQHSYISVISSSELDMIEIMKRGFPTKRFANLHQDDTLESVQLFLRLLGRLGDMNTVADYVFATIEQPEMHSVRNQLLYALGWMTIGMMGLPIAPSSAEHDHPDITSPSDDYDCDYKVALSRRILSELLANLDPENELNVNDEHNSSFEDINSQNAEILYFSLTIELIGIQSYILGPNFQKFLITSLFTLLSYLGRSNQTIAASTSVTLSIIANALGYPNVKDLLIKNNDYVANACSIKLRYVEVNDSVLIVLREVIRICGEDMIQWISDILEDLDEVLACGKVKVTEKALEILLEVCKASQGLSVPRTIEREPETGKKIDTQNTNLPNQFCNASKAWVEFYIKYLIENDNSTSSNRQKHDITNIEDFFRTYNDQKSSETTGGDRENVVDDVPQKSDKNSEDKLPPRINLLLNILTKSHHFLSSPNPKLCLTSLRILEKAVPLLSNYPKTLNPMLHSIFPSVLFCFSSVDKRDISRNWVILAAALRVVSVLSEWCTEFLGRRIEKEVLDRVVTLVEKTWDALTKELHLNSSSRLAQDINTSTSFQPNRDQTIRTESKQGRVINSYLKYTASYKLLSSLLQTLSVMLSHLTVDTEKVYRLSIVFRNLLVSTICNDEKIEEMVMAVFKGLCKIHSDSVWLTMCGIKSIDVELNVADTVPKWLYLDGGGEAGLFRVRQVLRWC
ncbi:hypothetical protein BKA69DRAFT_1120690 [Paraphysoderma sedebokerense]|nr:hypothetical protein BKA69DRAFT_1120690 [Paraphysoderma sedebokerense]